MRVILDTMPLIAYFKGEKGYERIRDLLRMVEENKVDGFISNMTLMTLRRDASL